MSSSSLSISGSSALATAAATATATASGSVEMEVEKAKSLIEKPLDENKEHILHKNWSFWVHKKEVDYSSSIVPLGDFSTLEQFWRLHLSLPKPSEILYTVEEGYKATQGGEIEGFSLFIKGVRPEWEDPMNKNGGEYHLRKDFRKDELDKIWQDLCLGLVCDEIEPIKYNEICGIRVVDRSKPKKSIYRFEVWYSSKQNLDKIRDKLEVTLDRRYDWEVKTRESN